MSKHIGTIYFAGAGGGAVKVAPENGREFGLDELREAVGGDVQALVPAERGVELYANEEGPRKGLPPNYHTAAVVSARAYVLRDHGWMAHGNLIAVREARGEDPDHGLPTVSQALRAAVQ